MGWQLFNPPPSVKAYYSALNRAAIREAEAREAHARLDMVQTRKDIGRVLHDQPPIYNSNGYNGVQPQYQTAPQGEMPPHDGRNPFQQQGGLFSVNSPAPTSSANAREQHAQPHNQHAPTLVRGTNVAGANAGVPVASAAPGAPLAPPPGNVPPPNDDGLIGAAVRFFYDEKHGGIQWGNIVGGAVGAGIGFFMGDYISGAAGGGMMGLATVAILSISGMAFGSRLANSLIPSSTPNTPATPQQGETIVIDKEPKLVQLTFDDAGKRVTLEGMHVGGTFTATHMIMENVNGQKLRFQLDQPKTMDLSKVDSPENAAILNEVFAARQVVEKSTLDTSKEGKRIDPLEMQEISNTVISLDDKMVKNYNDALIPAATPIPVPAPADKGKPAAKSGAASER